ncbi:NADPH-glutathione reductase [Arboricoccus pini]|uniref:NADPH-glutathione reductase n=1 Tax=Arboricoccus pini TaxID=1963835 RepID=A0A212R2F0_9PROT|nr:glutathione-disulfide reductase [Arboricoccus pini]SNB66183.1 NADPH-glutathione reductase [Arboricoccus pini]
MTDVDLFVLGGGSGGVACARRAAAHGAKVALAEQSRLGGTCVIRGCVPKKLMRYGAHFADYFKIAEAYGWAGSKPQFDFGRLLQARNREIERLTGIYATMLEKSGVRVIRGHGSVVGRAGQDFLVQIGAERLTARNVVIAVGGHPVRPEIEGIELSLTSDEILEDIYPQPARLAVVGGGYIGLEIASFMAGFGIETHLIIRQDLPLRGFDDDLRQDLRDRLVERGIHIHADTRPIRILDSGGGRILETDRQPIEADMVVMATGRLAKARTEGLGAVELGASRDPQGRILVNERYESVVPGLYAIGDCSSHAHNAAFAGQFDLTPIAIAEGRALAERLFNREPQPVDYRYVPTAVFAIPEAASVGMSETAARAAGHDVQIYRTRFRPMLYTIPDGKERTMMKIVVDKSNDRVLGVHMVGDDAAEIIQGLAVALTSGATKAQFDATVAIHPTAAEEFVTLYQPVG